MRIDRVILKAAISTILSVLLLSVFGVLILAFVFPSTMMTVSYDFGLDSLSVSCAQRAYRIFHNIEDIAFATEVAIGMEDERLIEECGVTFINDEDFTEYASKRSGGSGNYAEYIYSQVSLAKYTLGDGEGAIALAASLDRTGFQRNNALAVLVMESIMRGGADDLAFAVQVGDELIKVRTEKTLSEEDTFYLDGLLALVDKYARSD